MAESTIRTVPNALTLARAVLTLLAAILFLGEDKGRLAVILCAVAAALDGVDGWCARRFGQATPLGAFLDPLADKMLAGVMYAVIASAVDNMLVWALFILVVGRDVAVTAMRWRRADYRGASMPGKIKTAIQSVGGLCVLAYAFWISDGGRLPALPVAVLFGVVVFLSYVSAWAIVGESLSKQHSVKQRVRRIDSKGACRRPGTGPL
jgi:CDP-diacylglycerol--glycerol-3-phosphate 3-phosphatidyltransferase